MALPDLIKSIDKASAIVGGNKWSFAVCDATGSLTGAWKDGIYRKTTDVEFKTDYTPIEIESGETINTVPTKTACTIKITSQQDDYITENFLKSKDLYDTYFSLIIARGDNDSTSQKLMYVPIAKIERNYNSSNRNPVFNINVLNNDYDKFPSTVPSYVTVTTGSLMCSANDYYTVVSQSGTSTL